MNKLAITLCIGVIWAVSCLAQEYGKMTGDDLVRGNAQKEEGYTQAQLQSISKALKGKELTFHNGKVSMVRKDEDDGSVSVTVAFEAPAGGLFHPTFDVDAKVPASGAKAVEDLDAGTPVKELKGTVFYDEDFFTGFELRNAVLAGVKAGARENYSSMTGDDLVRGNAQKKAGYSQAQLQSISKALKGKELTFHNGKVSMVRKDEDDGSVSVTVAFEAPAGGLFHPTFDVDAKVSASGAKAVEDLDAGTSVKELKGTVFYDEDFFTGFELRNAVLAGVKAGARANYSSMTGDDLVRGNAQKKAGYSQAQLQSISKALKGKELTFHNGKVSMVRKDEDDGSVSVTVAFEAPAGGLFHPTFDVDAKVPASGAKAVEDLDAGTSVKELKGTVFYDEDFFTGFELRNALLSR